MMGNLGFHLSSSMSPSRDTLIRNRGRREVEDKILQKHKHTHVYKFKYGESIKALLLWLNMSQGKVIRQQTDSWSTRPEPLIFTSSLELRY